MIQKRLAIQCGRLLQKDGTYTKEQTVLTENNKILEIADGYVTPENFRILNAKEKWVTPGLIESHGHSATMDDTNEMGSNPNPIMPYLTIRDSINPKDKQISVIRGGGFTTCCVLPGSATLINGTGLAIKMKNADTVDEIEISECQPLKLALGDNPKMMPRGIAPTSRMGNAALIRKAFYEVKSKLKNRGYDSAAADTWQEIPMMEALEGKRLVKIHCHDPRDIVTAVHLAEEFGWDYTLEHVTGGYHVADFLREHHVRCCVGPLFINPLKYELRAVDPSNPARLEKAGVEFSLIEDACWDTNTLQLPSLAGICTAYGLSREAAMRGLTIEAAKNLHLEKRIGSVEIGKDADLAIFNGDPLLNTTRCDITILDGVVYENRKEAVR